jgi:hypothetical protein
MSSATGHADGIAASSTIVRLTIKPPHITHEIPELPLPRPLKTLNAPQLRTLRLEHVLRPRSVEWTFAALSSIAPSNRIHTLCLSNRTTRGIEFYDGDNVKKHFQRLDQIISCGFPQLQRLSFELQWWFQESLKSEAESIQEVLRRAMPVLNKLGIIDFVFTFIVNDTSEAR